MQKNYAIIYLLPAPNPAKITAVVAPAPGTLEVRWVNPSNINGELSSSRAIARPKDGGSEVNCSVTPEASSATSCSLTGLRNFTEYVIWVEVCTAPMNVEEASTKPLQVPTEHQVNIESTENYVGPSEVYNQPLKEEVDGDAAGGGCTSSEVKTKWTIPTAPDPAKITAVVAPAPGTLEVRWVNPSNINGELSSSRAIARPKDGGSEVNCSVTPEASSATSCSLTGLRNFTEYVIWVEVCTAPMNVEEASTKPLQVPTEHQVNIESTENYVGPSEVYNQPLKEEVDGDAAGGGCTSSEVKTKWTIPTAPDPAKITAVVAPAPGTLEVRWVNPSNINGELSSSRAIARPKDGGSEVNCSVTPEASSATSCSLTGLRNFTEYVIWVEVCTAPMNVEEASTKPLQVPTEHQVNIESTENYVGPSEVYNQPLKEEVDGDAAGGGCTSSEVKTKWTIPTAPDPAKITAVVAPAPGTLEVRWVNPSNINGELSSSRAIARPKDGGSEVNCSVTPEASSATSCSLTGLRNFTEYVIWVEVCTAPMNVEEASTKPLQVPTEHQVNIESTENYVGPSEVYNQPLKEEVDGDAAGGGCTSSEVKTKWTIPTAPDPAKITAVVAPAPGTLEVRWVNPSNINGELSSSRAIARPKDGGSEVNCSVTPEASSATSCSLTGLRNFTEYVIWVEVCTAPMNVEEASTKPLQVPTEHQVNIESTENYVGPSEVYNQPLKEEVDGDAAGGGCTSSEVKTKWTIPTAPDPAKITAVVAPAPGTLEVRWVNPSNINGELSSSRAIARPKDGGSEVNCSVTPEASSATSCSLTGLRNFTEYVIWVEVCTAPMNVEEASTKPLQVPTEHQVNIESTENYVGPSEVYNQPLKEEVDGDAAGGGCTSSEVKTKWTIPTAPDPAKITAVVAPAPGTLEVRWVNPSNINGELSSSRAIARPKDGGSEVNCSVTPEASSATSCSLTGLRNFTEYVIWVEVCTAPMNVEEASTKPLQVPTEHQVNIESTENYVGPSEVYNQPLKEEVDGDAAGGGCTSSEVKTKWTIPTAPDPAKITAVVAPAPGTLEVRWVNPSNINGELSSSRAIARPKDGGSEVNCSVTPEASSATSCSLTGLRNFTEYVIWVEVCTAPMNVEEASTKPLQVPTEHQVNIESTENYVGPSEVYNQPLKEEVDGDAAGGGCTSSEVKTKWTIPTAPDPAKITAVVAPAPGTLEVRWVNPSNINGELSSSRAIARPKDGGSEVNCSVTPEASSATSCSLTGLRNFTEYVIWVEVCTAPMNVEEASTKALQVPTEHQVNIEPTENYVGPSEVYNQPLKEEVDGDAAGGGCTSSEVKTKWTIPTAPDPAKITAVVAPAPGTLEVRWVNPSNINGELSSSRAIARPKDGGSEVNCSVTPEASSATSCSLTGLRNFTEYVIWVEVCTAPMNVEEASTKPLQVPTEHQVNIESTENYVGPGEVYNQPLNEEVDGDAPGGGCSNSSFVSNRTLNGAPDPANITSVLAPPFETLEVHWMNPSDRNVTLLSSTAIALLDGVRVAECKGTTAALSSAASCLLTGLRNFTEYEVVVEVCTGPAEVAGVRGGDCNYCTNTSSSGHRTSPGAEAVGTSTGLIVGVTFACLVVLAVVLFVVFWMRRRRTASPPLAKPEDFNFDPRKSHADIEPQYHIQTQSELSSQEDGVYEMADGVDVGGPKMNVYVDMPTLPCLKTNMPSQQPPPLPPRSPEEIHHPTYINLPGSTDALSKVTAPNVSLSANRLENAVMREGAGDVPQGQPQASAASPAGGKPVLPPRPLLD
ncbi:hypothetical protein SprV_0802627100 [Sparganum proliferum]